MRSQNTTEVENFPGFRDGIMGPDLMDHMRAQAERFGAELVTDNVTAVDLTGEVKTVTDDEGTVHRAKAVILSMGSAYRELGLPREKELSGHGVSWCANCDGFFFRDQDIAVVGGGSGSASPRVTVVEPFVVEVEADASAGPECSATRSGCTEPAPTLTPPTPVEQSTGRARAKHDTRLVGPVLRSTPGDNPPRMHDT